MTVQVIENLWIPLADGVRLAARLWRPEDADATPVPAILEYIPYRKRDGTRGRDEPMHGFFAQQGYAAIRVDMRGSGESDGLLDDEYLLQEQDDALEVIAWLAAQPWCTGAVGMMGKSWGGFNALQVAARRPPALKAIITVCSTDDRFADDIHYMGGVPAQRQSVVGRHHAGLSGPAGGPGDRGRGLARAMVGASRTHAVLAGALDVPPEPRRLLAARVRQRGFPGHRMPRSSHRRLGGRLYECGAAPARRSALPATGDHRSLGPHLSAGRRPRTIDRFSRRGDPLVGYLAQRP